MPCVLRPSSLVTIPSAPAGPAAGAAWTAIEATEPTGAAGSSEAAGAAGAAKTAQAAPAVMRAWAARATPYEAECTGAAAAPVTPSKTAGATPAFASSSTPSLPYATPEKIRSKKLSYDSWASDVITQEILHRRGKDLHVKFGPGEDDVETWLSKANRGRLQHILSTWDPWIESQGLAPLWESTPLKTPVKKMSKAAMAALVATQAASSKKTKQTADDSSVGVDCMRPGEYPRLIAIVVSDENWPKMCGSEQGSDNRLNGK